MLWPTITKDTPIEEIHRIHKTIWQYVVENGKKPETPYNADCVLCTYQCILETSFLECKSCPAIWYKGICYSEGSEYDEWNRSRCKKDDEKTKQLAEKIRDIPFKYEQEEKDEDS